MKVAIVGSRHYEDYNEFEEKLVPYENIITHVVSGGAKGTDTMAERWAHETNKKLTVFPANWAKYGKSAGPIRNSEIVQEVQVVIAFLAPSSKGTRDVINQAVGNNLPVHIINVSDPGTSTK